ELLESTVASANSALQRARATIDRQLPAPPPVMPDVVEQALLSRYVDAFEHDDVDGLVALLREDAMLRMPPQPSVLGAQAIARFFCLSHSPNYWYRVPKGPTGLWPRSRRHRRLGRRASCGPSSRRPRRRGWGLYGPSLPTRPLAEARRCGRDGPTSTSTAPRS